MISFIFSNMLKLNTGLLDATTFHNEQAIFSIPLLLYIADPFIITALWIFTGYLIKNKEKILKLSCLLFISIMTLTIINKIIKTDHNALIVSENKNIQLPDSAYKNHIFSKEGKNLIFVIADMFNGNYFERLLKDDAKYSEIFSGFSYYPDCLAPSSFTTASLPAIFAGNNYIPVKLNNNKKTGAEEINETSHNFFSNIHSSNYDITITNPLFFNTDFGNIENQKNYINYWEKKNGYENEKDYNKLSILFMLSIFNSASFHLKYIIYDKSNWIILRKSGLLNSIKNRTIENLAYIELLPEISSIGNNKNRFIYIHNNLTHAPYGIDNDGNLIKDKFLNNDSNSVNSSATAYYSAKKFIDIMGNWILWMKDNNVYDNTAIIFISDHGNSFNDNDIILPKHLNDVKNNENISRAQVLLLVKGFARYGSVLIDPTSLSLADIPALLKAETGIDFSPESDLHTARKHIFSVSSDWNLFLKKDTIKYTSYEVNGSIFNPDSWSIYKE